ncbi:MAG: hypothetical protein ACI9R3_005786, partial [Verrucomicrobiales bacterium]
MAGIAVALTCVVAFIQPLEGQQPILGDVVVDEEGTVSLSFTARKSYYNVLWRSDDLRSLFTPVALTVPELSGEMTINDRPAEQLDQAFYRISESSIFEPDDADGDQIDDVYEILFGLNAYALSLVPPSEDLVDDGRLLVMAALVGTDLHIRIFNDNWDMVIDKPESELLSGQELTDLKALLSSDPFPDVSTLSSEEKNVIMNYAILIAGHTLLNPFDSRDAGFDDDNDGYTALDNYNAVDDPLRFSVPYPNQLPDGQRATSAPASVDGVGGLLGVNLVNDAQSDYTPDTDMYKNTTNFKLSDSAGVGFHYYGEYSLVNIFMKANGSVVYRVDSFGEVHRGSQPLYYRSNYTDWLIDGFWAAGSAGAAEYRRVGEPGKSYFSVTDATPSARGGVVLHDVTGNRVIRSFRVHTTARIGGGTDVPGEGFSINFVSPGDPVLARPFGQPLPFRGFAAAPDGTALDLPEEGSVTGVGIGFDSLDNGGEDAVGVSVRVDGELVHSFPMATLHGDASDATSIQTGALTAVAAVENLGWAPLEVALEEDGFEEFYLRIKWKNAQIVDMPLPTWSPRRGRLVVAARTGTANQAHHFGAFSGSMTSGEGVERITISPSSFDRLPLTADVLERKEGKDISRFGFGGEYYLDNELNEVEQFIVDTTVRTLNPGYSEVRSDRPGPIQIFPETQSTVEPRNRIGFECERGCSRVYLVPIGSWYVEFPVVENPSALTLYPHDSSDQPIAQLFTSTADPRLDIGSSFDFNGFQGVSDLDQALKSANLQPLQDLDETNSNDFGLLMIPPSGITVFDSNLISDQLTKDASLVGVRESGAQIGTLRFSPSAGADVRLSGFGNEISQGGTYPWIRNRRSNQPERALRANDPTGLRSADWVRTNGANITSHSIEIANAEPSDEGFTIELSDCVFMATGGQTSDPLTGEVFITDGNDVPLGYIHFLAPSESDIRVKSSTMEAFSNIALESRDLTLDGGVYRSRNGEFTFRGGNAFVYSVDEISAATRVWFDGLGRMVPGTLTVARFGDSGGNSDRPGAIVSAPLNTNSEIRIDNFEIVELSRSSFTADNIRIRGTSTSPLAMSSMAGVSIVSTREARVFCNHELVIRDEVGIQNGDVAAVALTVEKGATLSLLGANVAVYTNKHNYGYGEFGTLLVNGVQQNGFGRRPSFNRRSTFDDRVESASNPVAWFAFDDAETPAGAVDLVSGKIASIDGPQYVVGRTGAEGDRALQFSPEGGAVHIADASFMNVAGEADKLSIVMWQKNLGTPKSSAFWFNSPSSSDNTRGVQAHLPWDDGVIYYDSGNCCEGESYHRLNGNPTGIATGGTFAWDDGGWHHYVFWKDGEEKRIYIDGEEFLRSSVANPLPTDFADGYIGGRDKGDRNPSAVIDDFAVFGTALTEHQIRALASGNASPGSLAELPSSIGEELVGYWPLDENFDDLAGDHHGTGHGSDPLTFADGRFGSGIVLDGVDQFVEITGGAESDFDFAGQSMSVSAWFKVGSFDINWQALVAKGEGGNWRTHRRSDGSGMAFSAGPGNNDTPDSGVDVNDGTLHHLVAVARDGEGSELWIDGVWVGATDNTAIEDNDMRVFIGNNPDSPLRFWNGLIDDVAIWGRALQQGEIEEIWNEGVGNSIAELVAPKLSSLVFSSGVLSPEFQPDSTTYTLSVANHATTITVIPRAAIPSAVVRINSELVSDGAPSSRIQLLEGGNLIIIEVSQAGGITKTYSVTVTRDASKLEEGLVGYWSFDENLLD